MKKFHNKTLTIKEDTYNIPVTLIIGDYSYYDKKVANKFNIERSEQKNFGAETRWVKANNGGEIIIWMPRIDFTSANYGTLAHELLHATFLIMENIGFKFDYNNTEPINYLFDSLMTNTLWQLVKKGRK